MKKRFSLVLALLLVMALMVSCFGNAAGKKYTIGYDIYFLGNTWSVQMYKEFQSEVKRHPDAVKDVVYVESEGKVDKQIANIEDLIVKKVDAIITTPNSPTALIPVLKKAQSKGIKVILLASTIKSNNYDALVTVNDYDFGKAGAEWLAAKLNGKGKIIALNGIAGISVSEDRWTGAKDVFAKYPGIKVLSNVNADWDYAKAKVEMSNILAAQPEIDGVWSQGGAMTLGAIEAFQAAKRPLVPMTSEDNNGFLKVWKKLKEDGNTGFDSIAVAKPTWLGSEALKVTLDLLQGKKVKKDQVLSVPKITSDTLDKFVRPDLPDSYWANTRMTDDEIKATFSK